MPEVPAHYVVVCVGTTGDVHPFMRIAKALVAMGRPVTFITNTHHARLLRGSGLAFVGVGTDEDYTRLLQDPHIWHPQKAFSALLAHYKEQVLQIYEAIQAVDAAGPRIVIAHPIAVPSAVMARERGIVHKIVSMYLAPSTLRTCHDPLRMGDTNVPSWVPMRWRSALWRFVERGWIDPVAMAQLNAARAALDRPGVQASFLGYLESQPDLIVTLFPDWFGPAMPDWPRPLLSGDFQLFDAASTSQFSPELTAFLAAGDKPLVFTPGTGHLHADAFFSRALDAVTRLDERAVFLTSHRAQVPAQLPASVLWQPYVPLSGLLPHVKAFIHHGGIGSTAEALRAGTPQLVAPFAWDQFDNGARVAELGVGEVIYARRLSARKLVKTIRSLTTSERVRTRCAQVSSRFTQQQDPAVLCAEIERLVLNS